MRCLFACPAASSAGAMTLQAMIVSVHILCLLKVMMEVNDT